MVIAASVLFVFFVFRFSAIYDYVRRIIRILQPLLIGFLIAYLVNPIAVAFDRTLGGQLKKKMKNQQLAGRISNTVSVVVSLLLFLLIIFVFLYLVVPEFIACIDDLIKKLPGQIDALSKQAVSFLDSNEELSGDFSLVLSISKDWLSNELAPKFNEWVSGLDWANNIASGVGAVANVLGVLVNFIKNFSVGFIFAFYLLFNKKLYQRQGRKLIFAFFSEEHAARLLRIGNRAHTVFSGFINGKLLDSLIIGILCFIGVSLLRMPYIMLIAVVIGVTNIIPVFGPYIGGIPCAVLVFLNSPVKCLYFVIFIILLQTLDGNILGPKILGDRTGLASIWVVISIVICGGLFGIFGMLIGVPVFALLYYLMRTVINDRLERKKLSVSTDFYDDRVLEKLNGDSGQNVNKAGDTDEKA